MAKGHSRDFLIKKSTTTLAAVTAKSFTSNKEPIPTKNDDDDGVDSYLDGKFASNALEITVEGFVSDDVLFDIALSTTEGDAHLSDITLTRHNGDVISGDFILTSYAENGALDDANKFTATLIRNGIHTLTPA